MLHVGHVGAPKRVDRLVVVADCEYRRMRAGKQPEPAVLQRVRILKFVDEKVREPTPVVLAQRIVAGQQLEGSQQQLGKIDNSLAPASLVVEREVLDLASPELVVRLDLIRPQPFLLRGVDERLQLARRDSAPH